MNAAKESRWTLQQLQRQMANDRLPERLYLVDQGWIFKGATAREIGVRGTIDIDVYRDAAAEVAERELRQRRRTPAFVASRASLPEWYPSIARKRGRLVQVSGPCGGVEPTTLL